MQIEYKNKEIMKICTTYSYAVKKHGDRMAERIFRRINEITATDSVEDLIKYSIGRCHPLKEDRKGQYAMDLVHPYRLVFKKKNENSIIVIILEVTDYH